MAKQTINIGTTANDGTGDPIRSAFDKTNDNFTELYDGAGVADGSVTTAKLADDSVTFAKLSDRYTALSALGTGSTFALDFSAATTFTATANANATFTFSNAKQGQVIDLILTGNYTITFSQTNGTFNKVGSTDYDGSTNNLIQIVCTNDSANPIYMYSVQPYASDPTP